LRELNFVYGANGSGKTTISRALDRGDGDPTTAIQWTDGQRPERVRVYNRDFVARTLANVGDLPGVFLLGEDSAEVAERIKSLNASEDTPGSISNSRKNLLGLETILQRAETDVNAALEALSAAAWKAKANFPTGLAYAWKRYGGSASKFVAAVIEYSTNARDGEPLNLEELKDRAKTVFQDDAVPLSFVAPPAIDELRAFTHAELLDVSIVGASDVPLAALIDRLDNSAWVAGGRGFLADSDGACPFCQQRAPVSLATDLAKYFDTVYESSIERLTSLQTAYKSAVMEVAESLDAGEALPAGHLNAEAFTAARTTLETLLDANVNCLATKLGNPSERVTSKASGPALATVVELLDGANKSIQEHNRRIEERATERPILVEQCWYHFVATTIASDLAAYQSAVKSPQKAIDGVGPKIDEAREEIARQTAELDELNSKARSSASTVQKFNSTLASVGFTNFKLASSRATDQGYALERDGELLDNSTLSEGERTFVTFLYYFWALRGSDSATRDPRPTVAVIDDPISSLDSGILWVVCQLIRTLMADVANDSSNLTQLIVLTHNAHFFREITYPRKGDESLKEKRTFATLNKRPGMPSMLLMETKNPVRSAYRGLWDEVAYAKEHPLESPLGLQNTMRRIIESYLTLLGGMELDGLAANFEGAELEIFQSFRAWANDGSHMVVFEELDHSPSGATTEMYLRVFERIFRDSHQDGHYDMMMAGLG
jgi:wobble nucleotide-excising tRNase